MAAKQLSFRHNPQTGWPAQPTRPARPDAQQPLRDARQTEHPDRTPRADAATFPPPRCACCCLDFGCGRPSCGTAWREGSAEEEADRDTSRKTDYHRELLAALRDRIAGTIENPNCNPVALAALSRQLVLIYKELTVLDTISGEDAVTVAAGQVNHDQLRIELVEPTNASAFVAINWPTAATVVDPKRFL